uniref:Putative antimicrobial peptide isamp n=1 Tax=Ixodes ricinus TaxID=34613 RepID=V5HM23_IXORI
MRAIAIVLISLLLLECFYFVEPAPTRQPHARRHPCERVSCEVPATCRKPCTSCNNGLWGDRLCKRK